MVSGRRVQRRSREQEIEREGVCRIGASQDLAKKKLVTVPSVSRKRVRARVIEVPWPVFDWRVVALVLVMVGLLGVGGWLVFHDSASGLPVNDRGVVKAAAVQEGTVDVHVGDSALRDSTLRTLTLSSATLAASTDMTFQAGVVDGLSRSRQATVEWLDVIVLLMVLGFIVGVFARLGGLFE